MATWMDDMVLVTGCTEDEWANWDSVPHSRVVREEDAPSGRRRDYLFPKAMYLRAVETMGVAPFVTMDGGEISS